MRKLACLITALILGCLNPLYSQENSDTTFARKELINYIEDKFDRVKSEKATAIYDQFNYNWDRRVYDSMEQALILRTVKLMQQKNYLVTSGLQQYLNALNKYSASGKTKFATFSKWHQIIKEILKKPYQVKEFNETLALVFGKQALYQSPSRSWYFEPFNFELKSGDEPYFELTDVQLSCITKGDTLNLNKTSGRYYPIDDKWQGQNGVITWQRVDLNPDKVYAELNKYDLEIKTGKITADTAKFHNKNIFDSPIDGKLSDKAMIAAKGKNARFPKIESFKKDFHIKGLAENVNYIGGYTLKGRQMLGWGTKENPAQINIMKSNDVQIKGISELFVVKTNGIVSQDTEVRVYLKQDSILHPDIKFNYDIDDRIISLRRSEKGLSQTPFYNSYHKLEMEVDKIEWPIDSSIMKLQMAINAVNSAKFRSGNHYRQGKYYKTQSILQYNPLKRLKKYCEHFNTKVFSDRAFADYLGIPLDNAKRMLVRLGSEGFLLYNIDEGEIKVQDKAFHYVNANEGKTDYDNLRFKSEISDSSNAELNLNTGALELDGVDKASLSDSQNVLIYPDSKELTIKKNRNLKLDGEVVAGRFQFFGDGFNFKYDSFKINLDNVDSLRLYFPEEETGKLERVKNVIQNIDGTIYIDHPKNKSGLRDYSQFPIFDCEKDAKVFYNKDNIQDGVYNKDSFYFQIKPFTADSLDNFNRKGIKFNGIFRSANILPEFDHTLTLMEDLSLGFEKQTPPEGYSLYGGKGKGYLDLKLNNSGLQGSGRMEYLASTTQSRNFIFFPDSMNSYSESFNITEKDQNKYPRVIAQNVYNHWKPYNDSMYINEQEEPILVYRKDLSFEGNLILTPERLYGAGKVNYNGGIIKADAIGLGPNKVSSDSAEITIKSKDPDKPAFYSPSVDMELKLDENKLFGMSNYNKPVTSFKFHKYLTSIRKIRWDISDSTVVMKTPPEQDQDEAYMISTNEGKDSLKLDATAARFDLENNLIEAQNIPYIDIADAQIYPYDKEVLIEKDAEIQTLENAKIKVDTNNLYHEFYDAHVNIINDNDYSGYGFYDYNPRNGKKQKLYFRDIHVANNTTVAKGEISDTINFFLNSRFYFQGNVRIKAPKKQLKFSGKVLPKLDSNYLATNWFQYQGYVNPDSVNFMLKQPVNKSGERLHTGIYLTDSTRQMYSRFMGKKKNDGDDALFDATGLLKYNFDDQQFAFGDSIVVKEGLMNKGNKFVFNTREKTIQTFGNINLDFNNENVDLRTTGSIGYNVLTDSFTFDMVMGIDFPFADKPLQSAADSILNFSFFRNDTRGARPAGLIGVANLIEDDEERKKIMGNLNAFGQVNSEEISYQPNLLFSDIQLAWDDQRHALITTDKTGLAAINGTPINKRLGGGLYLEKPKTGKDKLRFNMVGRNGSWYYFNISKGVCKVIASDKNFNDQVKETMRSVSESNFFIDLAKFQEKRLFEQYF